MSKVAQDVFIPALMFTNFVTVSSEQLISYFPVVILSGFIIFVGVFFGRALHKYVIKNKNYVVMVPLSCGFVHTLNIQLSMSETLGGLLDKIAEGSNLKFSLNGESRAIIFTTIITVVNTILRWSVMSKIIKENEKDYKSSSAGNSKLPSLEMGLLSANKGKRDSKATGNVQFNEIEEEKKPWWSGFEAMLNMPLIVCFFSIILSFIPPLQN